jgi:hypothetical protein
VEARLLEGVLAWCRLSEGGESATEIGRNLGGELPEEHLDDLDLAGADRITFEGVDDVSKPDVERASNPYREIGHRLIDRCCGSLILSPLGSFGD